MNVKKLRRISQLLLFALFNTNLKTGVLCPALYCYACPFASFGCPIGTLQNYVIRLMLPLYWIGALGLYSVTFGRLYCGWVCPFGAFQDLVSAARRGKKRKMRPFSPAKYVSLALVVLAAWAAADTLFCKICPAGTLFAAIPIRVMMPWLPTSVFFYAHLLTLGLVVISVLLFGRVWCAYFCPLGAVFGAFNKLSLVTIERDEKACIRCYACLEKCPVGISKLEDIGKSSNCILCGRCIDACPRGALKLRLAVASTKALAREPRAGE